MRCDLLTLPAGATASNGIKLAVGRCLHGCRRIPLNVLLPINVSVDFPDLRFSCNAGYP
jgi:hypothetical protein